VRPTHLILLALFLAFLGAATADEVFLKSGDCLSGTIEGIDAKEVTLASGDEKPSVRSDVRRRDSQTAGATPFVFEMALASGRGVRADQW